MRHLAILAAGALLAAGCSTTGSAPADVRPPQVVRTGEGSAMVTVEPKIASMATTVAAPPERVWAALSPAYGDLGISVTESDENARTLGNGRFNVMRRLGQVQLSRLLECGNSASGNIADTYRVRMAVRSVVMPEGSGSRIVTSVEASARTAEGTSNQTVACVANDQIAQMIAQRVRLRLASM